MNNYLSILFAVSLFLALMALILIFSEKKAGSKAKLLVSVRQAKEKIDNLLKRHDIDLSKQALIVADKMLDNILKSIVGGKDMGERLKKAKNFFPEREFYEKVWVAHKLRNKIVHEVDYEVSINEVEKSVACLCKAWEILGY